MGYSDNNKLYYYCPHAILVIFTHPWDEHSPTLTRIQRKTRYVWVYLRKYLEPKASEIGKSLNPL